jgi:hypothetical protein
LRKVYTAKSLADAHLLKGLLEGAHIPAEVQGEQAFQIAGQNPSRATALSVWILSDEQHGQAMELVAAFGEERPGRLDEGEPWRCGCGEENERQFTECWNCGRARPVF